MRTFVFEDDKSHKFWQIELSGASYTVTYGKVGTTGQTKTKTFPDEAKALKEHDKLVAEKLAKGYVETTTATPVVTSPLRAALEAALIENPTDLASHMAFADYLNEQGDPRGELVQVQLALEDGTKPAKERKQLQAREKALLTAHERSWLGPMAAFWLDEELNDWQRQHGYCNRHVWWRGWIQKVRIESLSDELAQAVVAQQHLLRLVHELKIVNRDYDSPGFATLLTGDFYRNVRIFQIGSDTDGCHMEGENTLAFVERMPYLEELYCYARHVDTAALFRRSMPTLRKLTVHHIYAYPLEILAANKSLANVTHLSFWPHGLEPDDEAAYITPEGALALFRAPHLTSLQHLVLRNSDAGDEGMTALVASGLLKRLTTLCLAGGCVTDAGAHTLAACADLRHLEALDISNNMIGPAGEAALRATGVKLEFGHQNNPDGRDEREYLWDGDPE